MAQRAGPPVPSLPSGVEGAAGLRLEHASRRDTRSDWEARVPVRVRHIARDRESRAIPCGARQRVADSASIAGSNSGVGSSSVFMASVSVTPSGRMFLPSWSNA